MNKKSCHCHKIQKKRRFFPRSVVVYRQDAITRLLVTQTEKNVFEIMNDGMAAEEET